MPYVEQLYTGCLAEAAYFIASDGEAAVIDPLRDPTPYMELAKKHNATIKYVIETHFHADFVSGHEDLAKKTGATIVYGPSAEPVFDAFIANDGEKLPLGRTTITVLHTPGHTLESSCYVLDNDEGKPSWIFTGDTLFIGDVGRPDLAQKKSGITQEMQCEYLFNSLRKKIMTLPDDIIVMPGHGAGSACGKNMSSQTQDTLANQKLTNYALRADMTLEEFTSELLAGLRAPPAYFPSQVMQNKGVKVSEADDNSFEAVMARGLTELTPKDFKATIDQHNCIVFDTRPSAYDFSAGHVPGSIFAGVDGSMATWVATVFPDVKQKYLLVSNDDRLREVVMRLARVGYDNCLGHLKGGMEAWKEAGLPVMTVENIPPEAFVAKRLAGDIQPHHVIDVRGPGEFAALHVKGAKNVPLCSRAPHDWEQVVDKTDGNAYYIHCAGGYRSMMFLSYAQRNLGIDKAGKLVNIEKGTWGLNMVPAFVENLKYTRPCHESLWKTQEATKLAKNAARKAREATEAARAELAKVREATKRAQDMTRAIREGRE